MNKYGWCRKYLSQYTSSHFHAGYIDSNHIHCAGSGADKTDKRLMPRCVKSRNGYLQQRVASDAIGVACNSHIGFYNHNCVGCYVNYDGHADSCGRRDVYSDARYGYLPARKN